ncbi:efflux RND transporter periplasmic adaptor subunit [Hydrogenobacter hydrogenophilus]|uniref:RND family efflux transporter, MFP subunit n=1 Tax=Hydrogenobacter hydrogenophilus TaxID=35835 RepID=A0A285P1C1_9AQUI|nr:efflux RND transporter periplasmic adaptor subunit [Hydrogenobacter hydrogenophilus]SNZ13671.1 RND family efflux transporter, MFP subunit [Hydrogenobacter hydrogenophilus]
MSLSKLISLLLVCFCVSFAQDVRVYAIVKGQVKKVYVSEGQRVSKGQTLVEIDPALYIAQREMLIAQLESQKLTLEKVEKDFKRYEELFNRDLLSKSEYEDWKNKYEKEKNKYIAIKAQIDELNKLIEYCTIKAPTNGVIKKLFVKEGIFVNGTMLPQVLLTIEER